MGYNYKPMLKSGTENDPGLSDIVYYAPHNWFETFAEPANAGAAPGDSVIITDNHTFKTPAEVGLTGTALGFIALYTTAGTQQLTMEPVGERDGRGQQWNLAMFHPGSYAEALEFARKITNDSCVILAQDIGSGKWMQLGDKTRRVEISPAFDSGTSDSGRKGWTLTATVYKAAYQYDGQITERDETV